jgi:hypothetical protein
MKKVLDGKLYDTETATLLADDQYATSASDRFNRGRATLLYRTPNGRYFVLHETIWEKERDTILSLDPDEARELFESLPNENVDYEVAFPDFQVEEA